MNISIISTDFTDNWFLGSSLLTTSFETDYPEVYERLKAHVKNEPYNLLENDKITKFFQSTEDLDIANEIMKGIFSLERQDKNLQILEGRFFNFINNIILIRDLKPNINHQDLFTILDNIGIREKITPYFLKNFKKTTSSNLYLFVNFFKSFYYKLESLDDTEFFELLKIFEEETKNVYEEIKELPLFHEFFLGDETEIKGSLTLKILDDLRWEDIKIFSNTLKGENPRKVINDFLFNKIFNFYIENFKIFDHNLSFIVTEKNDDNFKLYLSVVGGYSEDEIEAILQDSDSKRKYENYFDDFVSSLKLEQQKIDQLREIKELLVKGKQTKDEHSENDLNKSSLDTHSEIKIPIPNNENDNVDEKPNDGENLPDSETLENSSDDGISGSLVGDSNE
ncbi:MAG: hypothetical protein LBJ09_01245, partial [Clostridiales bacterium]|nr:hypothetical protein [Clostridiales bacterium]